MTPAIFKDYSLFRRKKTWWMIRFSSHISKAATLKVSLVGLKAFTRVGKFIKPTTGMIRVFGNKASKACFNLSKEELDRLLAGENLMAETTLEDGYVILRHEEDILGMGLLVNGKICSQLPRHNAQKLMKDSRTCSEGHSSHVPLQK
jgi:NOL1/NOP2/fmu family ribosome biogenesis protein